MAKCTLLMCLILLAILSTARMTVIKKKPKTCAEVRNIFRVSYNGYFTLYDSVNKPYLVFCDFLSDPGFAWTLIESLSTTNARATTRTYDKGFYYDVASNECTPNWSCYRLSKARMLSLKNAPLSTHYRATCNFDSQGVKGLQSRRDYLKGTFCANKLFFAPKAHATCVIVDYINVRGHYCRKCSLPFWTDPHLHLHIDVSHSSRMCGRFTVSNPVSSEDVFGHYYGINKLFSCTATATTTTNWWIGGPYRH
ncbi:hypothetical protein TrispH2_006278 [Trichoplax sp. H2]|nr:hypothetical protein TrispH2_006278 [Trichoplax sp. H2]|eukprot:RDD41607.1 hypothetical protein TrispH2_006278 [Trichoplax sp. H2]